MHTCLVRNGIRYTIERLELDASGKQKVNCVRVIAQERDIQMGATPLALDADGAHLFACHFFVSQNFEIAVLYKAWALALDT